MRIRKKVTEKKARANRNNGKRHSTGPRTARGKNVSRFNCVKHGLFAEHVVIPHFACRYGAQSKLAAGRRDVGTLPEWRGINAQS